MATTVSATAFPPISASSADLMAILSVCWAFSELCLILADICSMDEEASSAEAACSVAPWDMVSDPVLISRLPAATLSAAAMTSPTTAVSLCTMMASACISSSLLERSRTSTRRFPPEISLARLVTVFMASTRTFRLFLISLKSPL